MKRLILLLPVLLFPLFIMAIPGRILIEGTFPGAEGKEIRLLEYGDMISYRETEIASVIIDDTGKFRFNFNRPGPRYVFFRIDHARIGLLTEPGRDYLLEFERVDFARLDDRINPYLNPWIFNFKIKNPTNPLNSIVDELEDVMHDYMMANFSQMQRSRNRNLLQQLKFKTDSLFGHISDPYFKEYYRYLYGYYEQMSGFYRPLEIMQKYILNHEIQYHNPQYMNLFNTAFDTYIFAGSRRISLTDLRHTINEINSYHALMDSLGKDSILRNEVLRELVMLKGLQDMHGNADYKRANVENILSHVQRNSKFSEHRIIAANILHQKRYLTPGTLAPALEVTADNGRAVKIPADFKGKYVLIGFWTSWCETCMLDFVAMREIYSRYENDVVIIGISTDRNKNDYQRLLRSQNLPWQNFYFSHNFRLADFYLVRSLPTYILLDREGKILNYPARRPSDDLMSTIERLLHQERRSSTRR
jgi:thiol-disulfide isomerase/thioredoxin